MVNKFTKEYWYSILMRAGKTFCQTALGLITVGQSLFDVNWIGVFGVCAMSALISIITSLAVDLPEAKYQNEISELKQKLEQLQDNHGDLD